MLHAFLACFLLFKEFALARNIAAIALGDHVLAQGFDCLTRDDVGTDGGLDRDVIHLTRNDLAHLAHHRAAAVLGLGAVHDDGQRIDFVAIEQNVHLDHVGSAVLLELIVHRGIAARH